MIRSIGSSVKYFRQSNREDPKTRIPKCTLHGPFYSRPNSQPSLVLSKAFTVFPCRVPHPVKGDGSRSHMLAEVVLVVSTRLVGEEIQSSAVFPTVVGSNSHSSSLIHRLQRKNAVTGLTSRESWIIKKIRQILLDKSQPSISRILVVLNYQGYEIFGLHFKVNFHSV